MSTQWCGEDCTVRFVVEQHHHQQRHTKMQRSKQKIMKTCVFRVRNFNDSIYVEYIYIYIELVWMRTFHYITNTTYDVSVCFVVH